MALPGEEYVYSEYDLGIIADILTTAEHTAKTLLRKGKGGGNHCWRAITKQAHHGRAWLVQSQKQLFFYWLGAGNGDLSLQKLLKAYEAVLPKYQVKQ